MSPININQRLGKYSMIFLAASSLQIVTMSEVRAEKTTEKETIQAVSTIHPTTGNTTNGSVVFENTKQGVRITAELSGLPDGAHGFHIHATGDCSSGDGKSAGGHFNPHQVDHGGPDAEVRHMGDLGNIIADTNGKGVYARIDKMLSLEGPNSVVGKGIIIHAGEDDLTTQPTGAAGARIGCGVIE